MTSYKTDSFGVTTIDTKYLNRKEYAASYIIQSEGEAAIIETNTNFAIPNILRAVEGIGIALRDVKYVILTHVHLDHAGGAGKLMKLLPNAKLIVHPRGSRHMISPERLIESVKSVYGEKKYREMYGDIIPVQEDQIINSYENMVLNLGRKDLEILESPGHAKHHIIVFDKTEGTVFTGDSFGIGYPRFGFENGFFIFPSTSPVQFNPKSAVNTYKKIVRLNPVNIYLTHFGSVKDIQRIENELLEAIDLFLSEGNKLLKKGLKHSELSSSILEKIWIYFDKKIFSFSGKHLTKEDRDYLFLDADLNSKGIAFFLEKQGN